MNMEIQTAFEQGIIPGIVVAIYLIVVKIIDSRKKDPLAEIAKLLQVVTKDIIDKDKEKARQMVLVAFNAIAKDFNSYVTSVVINNNINTKKSLIEDNIKHLVSGAYYNIYSQLSMYKVGDKYLNDYMKEEWKDKWIEDMEKVIFNTELTQNDKILTYTNRIEIRIKDYETYIINNAF